MVSAPTKMAAFFSGQFPIHGVKYFKNRSFFVGADIIRPHAKPQGAIHFWTAPFAFAMKIRFSRDNYLQNLSYSRPKPGRARMMVSYATQQATRR